MQQHSHGASEHHHGGSEHVHDHDHAPAGAPASPALDLEVPDSELSPGRPRPPQLPAPRRPARRRPPPPASSIAGRRAAAAGRTPRARPRRSDGRAGRLPLAGRRPPHPHPVQPRRPVPGRSTRCSTPTRTAWTGWSSPTTAASRTPRSASTRSTPTSSRPAALFKDTLVFQGLEWNIPAAEHGTVFVHPGKNEVAVLKAVRERLRRRRSTAPRRAPPANEALAVGGPALPGRRGAPAARVKDALLLRQPPGAQGPRLPARDPRLARRRARRSPSAWRARPATRRPASRRRTAPARGRGFYDNSPTRRQLRRLPAGELPHLRRLRLDDRDRRRPVGQPARRGQAVVDHRQLRLAHQIYGWTPRCAAPDSDFTTNGRYDDPVHGARHQHRPTATSGPGYYSRTHVGADGFSYAAVMDGHARRPGLGRPRRPARRARRPASAHGRRPGGPARRRAARQAAARRSSWSIHDRSRPAARTGRSSSRSWPGSTSSGATSPARRRPGHLHGARTPRSSSRYDVSGHTRHDRADATRLGRRRRAGSTSGCAAPTATARPPA